MKGSKTDTVTSKLVLSQIIKEPTHIVHKTASCIELIFVSQPNLIMHSDSGLHPSLQQKYHHQIILCKILPTCIIL